MVSKRIVTAVVSALVLAHVSSACRAQGSATDSPPISSIRHYSFSFTQGPLTASGKTINAAEALFKEGKFRDAYEMCIKAQQLIRIEGKNASYNSGKLKTTAGYSLVEMGDYSEALKWLVPFKKSGFATFLNGYLAIAFAGTGRFDDASSLLKDMHVYYESAPVAALWKPQVDGDIQSDLLLRGRHYLGEEAMMVGQYNAALRHFKCAEAIDSHSTLVAYELGTAYEMLGRHKDAVFSFAWAAKAGDLDLSTAAKQELERAKARLQAGNVKPAQ